MKKATFSHLQPFFYHSKIKCLKNYNPNLIKNYKITSICSILGGIQIFVIWALLANEFNVLLVLFNEYQLACSVAILANESRGEPLLKLVSLKFCSFF